MTARGGAGPWPSAASANFDAGYYTLDLDLDFDTGGISGIVRATGRVVGTPMSALTLDLSSSMTVTEVRSPPYTAGDTLQYTHADDALTLPIVAGVGQSIGVEVHYAGTPDPEYFAFGERNGATYAWSYSEPYGARAWWPCKDHPSDKADSVHVRVTLPESMRAGSQGNLGFGGPVGGGRALFEWHSKFPIATYLVSVAAGEYVEYNEVYNRPGPLVAEFGSLALPLLHYVYDDGTSDLPSGWAKTADALEVLEEWFGPYPFAGEKYGHAEFTRSGAMEHQTMTSMGSSSRTIMVHELAHQWFGDLISPASWPHLWLNEGFATYAEILYWQDRDADQPGTGDILIQSMMRNAARAEGALVLEDTVSVSDMFNPARVYAKGGAVLHMLRAVMGESAFRTMLRDYAGAPALTYDVASTADFRAAAEAVYGASLGWFFDQWVTEGTGYPRYQVTAHLRGEGDYKAFVTVEQTQDGPQSNVDVFRMPVTIAVNTDGGQERFTVMNDERRQVFELDVAGRPSSVVFDPDLDLLRDVDLSVSSATVARTPVFESIAPNPMGRAGALGVVLPDDAVATLRLFDVAGRFVREVARVGGAGPHRLNFNADGLPSGVYFLRIDAPSGGDVRKLTVLR